MKNKKLVVALTAVVAAAAAVAGTSTFAWFTTTRTATVNVSNVQAYAQNGDLKVEYVRDYEGNLVDKNGTAKYIANGNNGFDIGGMTDAGNNVTDISGNGINFFKPNWKPGKDGVTASSIANVTDQATLGKKYYISFGIKLTNSSDSADMDVYLDLGTAISAATTTGKFYTNADLSALGATRLAIIDSGKANVLWSTAGSVNTSYTYISDGADSSKSAYGVSTYDSTTVFGTKFVTPNHSMVTTTGDTKGTYVEGDALLDEVTLENKAAGSLDDQKLVTLGHAAADNNTTIYVRIWLEGTSEYCVNDYNATTKPEGYNAKGGKTSTVLKFASI